MGTAADWSAFPLDKAGVVELSYHLEFIGRLFLQVHVHLFVIPYDASISGVNSRNIICEGHYQTRCHFSEQFGRLTLTGSCICLCA